MIYPKKGTPQGGVISPLLANIYLHWFDEVFHRSDGPVRWAGATLVRYADDFVVLAKYQSSQLQRYIEEKIEEYSAPKNMVVVSTDRRIRRAATRRKSTSVTSDLFWLSMIEQLDRKKPTPMPKEKRHGLTESETDQWMDEFDLD